MFLHIGILLPFVYLSFLLGAVRGCGCVIVIDGSVRIRGLDIDGLHPQQWCANIKMIYKYQHDLQIFWWSAIIMMVCKYYDGLQILWWFILSVKKSLQRNLHRCSLNIVNGITDTGMEYFNSINNIHQTLAKKQCSEQKTNVLTKSTHWKVGFLNDQSHISSTAEQKAWSKFNLGPIKTWTKMQRKSSTAEKFLSSLITYCCKFTFISNI